MTTTIDNDHRRSGTTAGVLIQVLHVPDCAHLDRVRAVINTALTTTGIAAAIDEVVGDFPSPTVLVNGVDVTGRSVESGAACRLDLPTEAQLCVALTNALLRTVSPS